MTTEDAARYLFETLSDDLLDGEFSEYDIVTEADVQESQNQETAAFLNGIYEQGQRFVGMVQERWRDSPTPAILLEFQRNMRYLNRLLKNSRYPRLALIGRRGAGKSSLINAILGQKVAEPGHMQAQTGKAKILCYRLPDGSGMDVVDTRGLNEGGKPVESDESETAVDSIVAALKSCPVDCILFIHKAKEVDSGIESDILKLKEIMQRAQHQVASVPIIVVLTHVDELEPSDVQRPQDYDEEKLSNIEAARSLFQQHLRTYAPQLAERLVGVECISCKVIWGEIDAQGNCFPRTGRDYRFGMENLLHLLMRNIEIKALFRTIQAARVGRVKVEFAEFLIKVFASVAAVISMTPIPSSDVLPISIISSWMIYTIAKLGNQSLSWESTYKFFSMIGFTGMAGYTVRVLFSELTKFLPGLGTVTSAAVTYGVIMGLGKSAIAFYLEKRSEVEVKEIYRRVQSMAESEFDARSLGIAPEEATARQMQQ